ncbi:glycosyl hydrolase [Caldicoprobacter faecalis]|uniref:Alpha-L-rhamnosidase n=1 Tax=Caldicoprobacter faecalis TaxID=937334 RepID=A0A1I5XH46_9FIRM|nr:glycosyl hydrolase [Caldicoprobacter faecalis]SFQ31260.1 alpha-L-rhamnosidase [Caldicoprobacter faecalis]
MSLKFGIQPFWFWNGDMRDDEIRRQIREMAEKGIKGFFIHPRQGLSVPYLSEEWFRKVGIAVEEAKKRGLEVWLYDEYPYPSGVSGGLVVLDHPEFEAKALKARIFDVEGPKAVDMELPWGQALLARAYPKKNDVIDWDDPVELLHCIGTGYKENIFQMSGLTQYNRKRFFTGKPVKKLHWDAPEGTWHVCIVLQVAVGDFKYFGKYVDPLNPEAMRYYINTTHEQYKKYFSHEFGKTIKGIFTDEITAFPPGMPWSPLLPEMFEKRNGYSLVDRLPALFERMGLDTDRVRYDYWNTVTNAFIESYEVQVRDWCEANNLLYVGEKPILRSKQLKYFHIPGIDAGHQKVGTRPDVASPKYRANAKLVSSAAHFYGKPGTLCECFHSIGWGMTLQDMKWTFDWLAVQGIGFFVPHAFFYTTDGLTKHDAPPSSFYQMPYWSYMGLLSDYADKITDIMKRGRRKADIIILDPISSQWTAMGEKRHLKEKLENGFSRLQRALLENHFDYYIMDPELFSQCDTRHGCIRFRDEEYKVLILPPMLNIEECALEKLKEYIEGGGIVIGVECLPVEKIGSSDTGSMFSQWFDVDARDIYGRYVGNENLSDARATYTDVVAGNVYNEQNDENQIRIEASAKKKKAFFVKSVEEVPEMVAKMVQRPISIIRDTCQGSRGTYQEVGGTCCESRDIQQEDIYQNAKATCREVKDSHLESIEACPAGIDASQEKDILAACYEVDGQLSCFLVNTSGTQHRVRIYPNCNSFLHPQVSCSDPGLEGSESIIELDEDARERGFVLEFAPYQAYILTVKERQDEAIGLQAKAQSSAARQKIDLDDNWEVHPKGMNALRLGLWRLKVEGSSDEKLVECKPIIDQIHDTGIALPVKLKDHFGCPKQLELPTLNCIYTAEFSVEDDVSLPVLLVMEPGSVQGEWYMLVNGNRVNSAQFAPQEIYLPTNLAVDISPYIKKGLNEIQVRITTQANHDGLVNPLYLFGRFGVVKENGKWKLCSISNVGKPGDLTGIGLPFYAGTVVYRKKVFIDGAAEMMEMYIDDTGMEDVIALYVNGHLAGTRAWSPYRWIIDKDWIRAGENELELHVTNTLIRLFEGQYFDHRRHAYVDVCSS